MKNTILFLVCCLFCVSGVLNGQELDRSIVPEAGPAPKIQIGEYESFTLDNGLKCFVVENRKLPRVSFRLTVDSDPYLELEKVGVSGMMGQLLRTGTSNRSKDQIDEEIDFVGASLGTSSGGVSGSCLTRHTETLLEVMSDVLLNPIFSEEELEKIRVQELSGLESNMDDAGSIARTVSRALRYGKTHPYGEVITKETIGAITVADCKALYEREFLPNQSYLVIVGDIDNATAKKYAEKYFASWKKGEPQTRSFDMPAAPEKNKVTVVNKDGAAQSVITITYPVDLQPGSADAVAVSVMNDILGGGGFQSRLFQNLREDKGYTYGAYSGLRSDRHVAYFAAQASVRNEVTDSSIVEFMKEMNRIVDEDVSDEELQVMLNIKNGDFARALEKPTTVARFALNTERYNLPKDYYATYLERLSKVTPADVRAAAKKYIHPENAHIVIVGSKDEIIEKVARFSADGKVQLMDAFANEIVAQKKSEMSAEEVMKIVSNFVDKVGGKKKIESIKSRESTFSTNMGGMSITTVERTEGANKYHMEVLMTGKVIAEEMIVGSKGYSINMGNKQTLKEEECTQKLKTAAVCPQLAYLTGEQHRLEYKGKDEVKGESVHKIFVYNAEDEKSVEFYSVDSGLLLKEVKMEKTPAGPIAQTTVFSDYKPVDGILLPHQLQINISTQKVDVALEKAVFNLEFPAEQFKVD